MGMGNEMFFFDKKFLKFLLVGVINTLVGAGVMFLMFNLFHCSYWLSSVCNYIVGGIVSFILNKIFTFQNKKKSFLQFIFFVVNLMVCYVIAYVVAKYAIYAIFSFQTEQIKGNIAMAVGMVLYTGLNYIGQRFVVFAEKSSKVKNEVERDSAENEQN